MVNNTFFVDFGMILVFVCRFLGTQMFKKMFCFWACFQVICLSISHSKYQRLGLPNQGFRMEGFAAIDFGRKSFFKPLRIELARFLDALKAVFQFF